jgi:hypothetical protein
MLIIETHGTYDDGLRVYARMKGKGRGKGKRLVCFRAGVVVRQQLESQRFFPVWARLSVVQGKAHEYYKLDLACTTEVRGETTNGRWRVNYDAETNTWEGADSA